MRLLKDLQRLQETLAVDFGKTDYVIKVVVNKETLRKIWLSSEVNSLNCYRRQDTFSVGDTVPSQVSLQLQGLTIIFISEAKR